MLEEIYAFDDNHTWDLVDLPKRKNVIGYKWVFAIKVNSDDSVPRLKTRLEAKAMLKLMGWTILIDSLMWPKSPLFVYSYLLQPSEIDPYTN